MIRCIQTTTLVFTLFLVHVSGSETLKIGSRKAPPNLSLAKIHTSGYSIDAVEPSEKVGWSIGFGSANSAAGELIVNEPYITLTGNRKTAVDGTTTYVMSGGFTGYRKHPDGILADIEITIVSTDLNQKGKIGSARINHHAFKVRATTGSSGDRTLVEIITEP